MFGRQPPNEPPLTQQEVNALEDGETVIVKPPHSPPSEWTISAEAEGTLRVAEKFGFRLVLEPVGDSPEETVTCVWRVERSKVDEFGLDTDAIEKELETDTEDGEGKTNE